MKFGERVFIKRAKGDRQSQRDMYKERDRRTETKEFTAGKRETTTFFFFSSVLSSSYSF